MQVVGCTIITGTFGKYKAYNYIRLISNSIKAIYKKAVTHSEELEWWKKIDVAI